MNRVFVLFVVVNVLVVGLGGLIAYSDLHIRNYDIRRHSDTQVIEVEYSLLVYRPTYEYFDIVPQRKVVTRGCWALDTFQLSIIVMAFVDVAWLYSKQKRLSNIDGSVSYFGGFCLVFLYEVF